jgi:cytochrome c-type biogenesis protein CcmH/NrfG
MVTAPTVRFGGRVEVAYESITNLTIDAWTRLTGRDEEDYWEALMRRRAEADASDHPRRRADYADRWDLADAVEFSRRLPRLVRLLSIPQPT